MPFVCWQSSPTPPHTAPNSTERFERYRDEDYSAPNSEAPQHSTEKLVSDELSLTQGLTPRQLRRIRKVFAFKNHPDRVGAAFRVTASERMKIANTLIDNALKLGQTQL